MNPVIGSPNRHAVKTIPRIPVREDEILCTGGDGYAKPVACYKRVGQLRSADFHLIDLTGLHELGALKLVAVADAYDTVGQLHGTAVFIHVRNSDHQIRIFTIGGDKQFCRCISGNR